MSIRSAGTTDYLPTEADADFTEDSYSVIDRHSSFDGTFRSDRDLRIDGEVKGTIECQGTLFVAEGATVDAKVDAENVTVAGDLNGEIICRGRLQMLPSGRVKGKISTVTLVIAEGAYYEGELEMARPEDRETRPRRVSGSGTQAPVPINGQVTEPRAGASSGAPGGATTFIRRLGSPETPWDNRGEEDEAPAASAEAEQGEKE